MSEKIQLPSQSRRQFLANSGKIVAASALAGVSIPFVHGAETNTINVALVGAGGRGTGAAANALSVKTGPTKLIAVADTFEDKLTKSCESLASAHADKMDLGDRKFVGIESYKQAMDALRPGDIVILATPPAFRWPHFKYAIDKGLNVFMEKPVTVDGPSTRRMLELGAESEKKGLKVGVGLMCRHCPTRKEMFNRIQQGEIGDLIMMRAYRQQAPIAMFRTKKRPDDMNELDFQIRNFHSFLWLSGGSYSDFFIHNIDEACWMKNAWPTHAEASGGRHYREDYIDQNFDTYSVEYTFADGSKFFFEGRNMEGCKDQFATYVHGAKGMGVVSSAGHAPAKSKLFKGQNIKSEDLIWQGPKEEANPYQEEWENLTAAIRKNEPFNEVKRGAEVSLVTSMGRMAAHTGQTVTFEEILNSTHEFAPDVDKLTKGSPSPLLADANGIYPVPVPGVKKKREY